MKGITKLVLLLSVFAILSCSSSKKAIIQIDDQKHKIYQLLSQLKPGDTMTFGPGVYDLELIANIGSGNNWEKPVVLMGNKNKSTILRPKTGFRVVNFNKYREPIHHIEINGFVLDAKHVTSDAVKITDGNHHIRIKNCEIKNAKNQGILIANQKSTYNEIINCTIHNNGITDFEHGIYISSDHNLVDSCIIYSNAGAGINVYHGKLSANHNTITNCHIYKNGRAGKRGAGIGLHTGRGNIARNNLIHNNKTGIHTDYGAEDSIIEDNIIFDHPGYDLIIGERTRNCLLKNNTLLKETSYPEYQFSKKAYQARVVGLVEKKKRVEIMSKIKTHWPNVKL